VLTETDGLLVSSREPVEPEDAVSVVGVLEKR
jgi:hypothetical protein